MPDPLRQHGVLIDQDHRGGINEEHGGKDEPAEGEIVGADALRGLGQLFVHLGGELLGGGGLFENRGHGSSH